MTETGEKTKVTEQHLKALVLERLGFAAFLTVHRAGQGLGFTVGIMTAPTRAVAAQQAVDNIVADLRGHYELIDG